MSFQKKEKKETDENWLRLVIFFNIYLIMRPYPNYEYGDFSTIPHSTIISMKIFANIYLITRPYPNN